MKAFRYVRPASVDEAVAALADGEAQVKASGIDLLDRMKERVDEPALLVGLLDVPGLDAVEITDDGVRIGAGTTLAQLAASEAVRRYLPTLAEAALLAASPQLRNRATIGGNLAQHTRCGYYRHASFPCLKRSGTDCPVRRDGGVQDTAGVFANGVCASAHPSSIAPVLGALDAVLVVHGAEGAREIAFADAWAPPQSGRAADLALRSGELIVTIEIPGHVDPQRTGYDEVRQKAAFDWPLVTCAVRLGMRGDVVKEARIWLGSVAPTPWHATKAEEVLAGKTLSDARIAEAGDAAVVGASPLAGTTYKVQLTRVAVRRALAKAREAK